MKILITGGSGYIGGRLNKYFSNLNYEIYLASRSHKHSSYGNHIVIDWNKYESLQEACKNMDVVVHCAGMNSLDCQNDPIGAFKVNEQYTRNLAKVAIKHKVKTFVYLSTAHVYSSDLSGSITEDTMITNMHPYAASHYAGEKSLIELSKNLNDKMQIIIIRLANSFGPPADMRANCWGLVVNNFCKQAATDSRIIINGPSNTIRNFITITDLCSALNFLLCYPSYKKPLMIFNLGDKTKSIFDIAMEIVSIYKNFNNVSIKIIKKSEDNKLNKLDFKSNAIMKLGWEPESNFTLELKNLINFCEMNFNDNS